jgi:SAM-dependent methyltransferase
MGLITGALKRVLPVPARRWLRARARQLTRSLRPVGGVRFGNLRRVTPISRNFGYDRGTPIDRYYIERFLGVHAGDVRGRVLEIAESVYTRRFGGERVIHSEVLHVVPGNPEATVVGDLTGCLPLPPDTFDCIICTQTLPVIYRVGAALGTLYRILRPGGVLLLTVPGVAHQISRPDMDLWGDYWRFTSLSVRRLLEEVFPPGHVQVRAEGNVLAAVAFLHGIAVEELLPRELDYRDPDYELSILARADKPAAGPLPPRNGPAPAP